MEKGEIKAKIPIYNLDRTDAISQVLIMGLGKWEEGQIWYGRQ